jgi:hypothetical protein
MNIIFIISRISGFGLEDPGVMFQFLAGCIKLFVVFHSIQTSHGAQQAPYSVDTGSVICFCPRTSCHQNKQYSKICAKLLTLFAKSILAPYSVSCIHTIMFIKRIYFLFSHTAWPYIHVASPDT